MDSNLFNDIQQKHDAFVTVAPWLRAREVSDFSGPRSPDEWQQWSRDVAGAGLSGIILERAVQLGVELPEETRQYLTADASSVVAANLHLEHELTRIVTLFNRQRIPVMLLKGAALNRTIYDHPNMRPMADIDLLVRPADVMRAMGLLSENGCRKGVSLVRDDFFPRYYYETEWFVESARPVRIDLHARPLRPMRLARLMPDDALWHDAAAVRVGQATAFIPRRESMLIHLAAHAAYHGCERLIWLYDMKRFIQHYQQELDWTLLAERCREWSLSLPVLAALKNTEQVLGTCCPKSVMDALSKHPTSWKDRWALRHAPSDSANPVRHVLVNLACTPGFAFRCGYLFAMMTPHRNHLAGVYPYRHRGWPAMANTWRSIRAVGRLVRAPLRKLTAKS